MRSRDTINKIKGKVIVYCSFVHNLSQNEIKEKIISKFENISSNVLFSMFKKKYPISGFPEIFKLKNLNLNVMSEKREVELYLSVYQNTVSMISVFEIEEEKENISLYAHTIIVEYKGKKMNISEFFIEYLKELLNTEISNNVFKEFIVFQIIDVSPKLFFNKNKNLIEEIIFSDISKDITVLSENEIVLFSRRRGVMITTSKILPIDYIFTIDIVLNKYLELKYYTAFLKQVLLKAQEDVNYAYSVPWWRVFFDRAMKKITTNLIKDRVYIGNMLKEHKIFKRIIIEYSSIYVLFENLSKKLEIDEMYTEISKELDFLNQVYLTIQNIVYTKQMFFIQMILLTAILIRTILDIYIVLGIA